MKKIFFKLNNINWVFAGVLIVAISISCKKYNSLSFTPGTGAPVISSVHTWSKTDTTVYYDTIITYNSSGSPVQTLQARSNRVIPFDSATTAGNLGNYYIIYGSNLGSATNITFNGYTAYFNRALLTDNSIVVQVPSKTPYYGDKATDSLVVTTLHGHAYYKFSIMSPAPTPATYSDYNFYAGSQITLTGIGFASVTSVSLADAEGGSSTADVTIVNQNDSVMTLQFPSTTMNVATLVFNYSSAGTATIANDKQQLVDLDNAYQILGPTSTADPSQTWAAVFQNNGMSTGWVANGWSSWATSTSVVKGAGISFYGKFDNGGWKVAGFQFNTGVAGSIPALAYDPSYKYLSFWVINTGVAVAQTAYIQWGDNVFGQNKVNPITIQPNAWQYFKIPISSLNWNTGSTPWSANISSPLMDVAFFLTCQNANGNNIGEADLYFTNVVLIK